MGFYYSDDPLRDHDLYERDRQRWLDSLPKCDNCGEPIQEERYFEVEGARLCCDDCLVEYCERNHSVSNEYL